MKVRSGKLSGDETGIAFERCGVVLDAAWFSIASEK